MRFSKREKERERERERKKKKEKKQNIHIEEKRGIDWYLVTQSMHTRIPWLLHYGFGGVWGSSASQNDDPFLGSRLEGGPYREL